MKKERSRSHSLLLKIEGYFSNCSYCVVLLGAMCFYCPSKTRVCFTSQCLDVICRYYLVVFIGVLYFRFVSTLYMLVFPSRNKQSTVSTVRKTACRSFVRPWVRDVTASVEAFFFLCWWTLQPINKFVRVYVYYGNEAHWNYHFQWILY